MGNINKEQLEFIAETVESDPASVSKDDLEGLLNSIEHSDYNICSAAGDALEELVDTWSADVITENFHKDLLDGRLQTDSVTGGKALSNVVLTLAEKKPEQVRPIGRQVGLAPAGYFDESDAKEALCMVFSTEELATEAKALISANDSTPRNVGVRIVKELGAEGTDLDETDPDAADAALPAVWDLACNGRENSKPRENAIKAMIGHARLRPEDHVDNISEIIELLNTTKSTIRSDLIEYLTVIAEHDPDIVVPTVPLVRREFDDKTASYGTLSAAVELIAEIVESHPVVAPPLDPFIQRIKDDDNRYDDDAVTIVAAAGGIEQLKTMLTAEKYEPRFGAKLADTLKDDMIVFEELQELCFVDHPEIRHRAVSTIVEEFHDRLNVPVSLYLDLLDDDGEPSFPTSYTVAGEAMKGIEELATTDPNRLIDAVPKLRESLRKSFCDGGRYSVALSNALGHIARADQETYAQLVDDLNKGDKYVRRAAVTAISGETEVYPPEFDDPVPVLLDIYHSPNDDDITVGGEVLSALGGLAYSRPDALEGAVDFLLERYEKTEDVGVYRKQTADFAGVYPSELAELIEELASNYTEAYSGDYEYDASMGVVALAHFACVSPERVREAVATLAERTPDERPPSFPLIRIALGDHDKVSSTWGEEDGWLSDRLVNGSERMKLRLCRVLAKSDYTPAKELLATIRDDESATDIVQETATEAIKQLK